MYQQSRHYKLEFCKELVSFGDDHLRMNMLSFSCCCSCYSFFVNTETIMWLQFLFINGGKEIQVYGIKKKENKRVIVKGI